jgi:hypothetical protein
MRFVGIETQAARRAKGPAFYDINRTIFAIGGASKPDLISPSQTPGLSIEALAFGEPAFSTDGARRLPHYFLFFGPMLRMKTTICHVSFSESVFL